MNATALRASLFAPSFRRRVAFATRNFAVVTPVTKLTTEDFHALQDTAAPVHTDGGFPTRLSHLPSSGLTL